MPRKECRFHHATIATVYWITTQATEKTSQLTLASQTHNMAFYRGSFEQYLERCDDLPADPFAEAEVFYRSEVERIDEGRPLSDIDWVPPHVIETGMPPAHMQLLPWLRKGARATADSIREQAHNSVGSESPFDIEDLPDDTVWTVRGNELSLYDLYPLATPGYPVNLTVVHVLLNELRVDPRGSLFFLPGNLMDHPTWQRLMEEYGHEPVTIEASSPPFSHSAVY
jgi:hypothetical protein